MFFTQAPTGKLLYDNLFMVIVAKQLLFLQFVTKHRLKFIFQATAYIIVIFIIYKGKQREY